MDYSLFLVFFQKADDDEDDDEENNMIQNEESIESLNSQGQPKKRNSIFLQRSIDGKDLEFGEKIHESDQSPFINHHHNGNAEGTLYGHRMSKVPSEIMKDDQNLNEHLLDKKQTTV